MIFSLISIVVAYFYSRRFVDKRIALAVAVALLVSSWHIEFARFIRMYALFQGVALGFLIAFDAAYFRDRWDLRYLPHGLAALAALSHELGILLTPLLFLPLLPGATVGRPSSPQGALRFAVAGLITMGFCYLLTRVDFRNWGVTDRLPETVEPAGLGLFVPAFPFWQLHPDPLITLAIIVAAAALGVGILLMLRHRGLGVRISDAWLFLLLVAALAHQFAVAAIVLVVLVCRYRIDLFSAYRRRTYVVLFVSFAIGAAWLAYALAAPERLLVPEVIERWGLQGPELTIGTLLRALWTTFFGWPELYHGIIRPFAVELPLLGLILLVALGWVGVAHGRDPLPSLFGHPAFIIVYTIGWYSVFRGYSTTRYWFHLYPVILCLIGLVLAEALRQSSERWPGLRTIPITPETGAAALLLLGFALSADFNPRHIALVADESVAFRTGEFAPYATTWYPRADYKSPADFVAAHADSGDDVRIIVDNQPPVSYYLEDDHAVFYDRANPRSVYHAVARRRGTLDLWSDMRLLGSPQEIRDHTQSASEVWIIRDADPELRQFDVEQVWGHRLADQTQMYTSRDGVLEVARVRLKPEER